MVILTRPVSLLHRFLLLRLPAKGNLLPNYEGKNDAEKKDFVEPQQLLPIRKGVLLNNLMNKKLKQCLFPKIPWKYLQQITQTSLLTSQLKYVSLLNATNVLMRLIEKSVLENT